MMKDLWIALETIGVFMTKHAKTIKFIKKRLHGKKFHPSLALLLTKLRRGIIVLEQILQNTLKMRDPARSGSGRIDMPEMREEYEHLQWLLQHIKHRVTTAKMNSRAVPLEYDTDLPAEQVHCQSKEENLMNMYKMILQMMVLYAMQ